MFLQAAVEGIGFYFSTGDDGDNTVDGPPHPEPDYPASDPLVTAVGGTTLAVTSSNGVPVRDLVGRRPRPGQLRDRRRPATRQPLPGAASSSAAAAA